MPAAISTVASGRNTTACSAMIEISTARPGGPNAADTIGMPSITRLPYAALRPIDAAPDSPAPSACRASRTASAYTARAAPK